MKKLLTIINILILLLALTSCSNKVSSWESYTMDKEITLDKTITKAEAIELVKSQNKDAKYISCELSTIVNDINANIVIKVIEKGKQINGYSVTKTILEELGQTSEVYIQDNYRLFEFDKPIGKVKAKIPENIKPFDVLLGYSILDLVIKFLNVVDENNQALKLGYDANGCLILEYIGYEDFKLRAVFDDGYPVFVYTEEEKDIMQFLFSYDKFSIEFPETLKKEDYTTVDWNKIYKTEE